MSLETAPVPDRRVLKWSNTAGVILDISGLSPLREIKREQFEVLYKISAMLNTTHYQESLIEQTLDLVIQYLQAERGLFARYEKSADSFAIIAARNVQQDSLTDLHSFSSGILRQVVARKETSLYHDAQGDPAVSQFASVQLHNIKSVIGVPVFYKTGIWGVILVDSQTNRREFTAENLFFLEFFASLVSLVLERIMAMEQLQNENLLLRKQLQTSLTIPEMIGKSQVMQELYMLIQRVAGSGASVLILGESGTGKELVARAIHKLSDRADKPFLAQFCGSIPDTLLESELFGYKKGAFSGAYQDKKGLFEVADQGTFFLDEIADISLALQAKLLRVLENQEIIRLGDTQFKKVDVRIITATNKDLYTLVKEGKFREDLYYRLNVFPITLPPLRDRKGDVPLLARHFISKNTGKDLTIEQQVFTKLESYSWPGNVRQLENVLQRALILSDGQKINAENIFLQESENLTNFHGALADFELLLLKKRLEEYKGNRTLTAKSLGVSVRWVQMKLKELGESK
jgi:Nif-specific regulatory protein